MDSSRNTPADTSVAAGPLSPDGLSSLSWVRDELRRSIETALKALRRHVRDLEAGVVAAEGVSTAAQLQTARQQLRAAASALELCGAVPAARVLSACEASVQQFVDGTPQGFDAAAVQTVEAALFALLDFVERLLAGRPVSPLSMFVQYQAVQQLAGAERVHPADLWDFEWRWPVRVDLPADPLAGARLPDAATRSAVEGRMLTLMRGPNPAAAARMSDLFAGLGAGATDAATATLWQLAAAMFEAQSLDLLVPDVFSKRVVSRLLGLLRNFEAGKGEVPEALARELLFFCAQSAEPDAPGAAPRLAAVRAAFGLAGDTRVDYHRSSLGRFDPALITQARKRLAAAQESWSGVAAGEMHRVQGLLEQFALVGDSLRSLLPPGEPLAEALQLAATQIEGSGQAPSAAAAMEVATALLYTEACLEDGDFDHPELPARARRLSDRVRSACAGAQPQPLEGWMEDLYRRVSDRKNMGSVVRELRVSLAEAERNIDQFFRNPADSQVLIQVPRQLTSMRGVLSVLGMDHAAAALLRMCEEVDGLTATEVDPDRIAQAGVFDRLAHNLGVLGLLIDLLAVQPTQARTLFSYDAETGVLSSSMSRAPIPEAFDKVPAPTPMAVSEVGTDADGSDDEMRLVFLEEAREVLASARAGWAELAVALDDMQVLAQVRRAFHTLKGSARMVGLQEFSDAAWVCEQVFNSRLAGQQPADAPLLACTERWVDQLDRWVEDIAAAREPSQTAGQFSEQARQLEADATPIEPEFDLDLTAPAPVAAAAEPLAAEAQPSVEFVDFGSMFGNMGLEAVPAIPAEATAAPAALEPPQPFDLFELDLDLEAPARPPAQLPEPQPELAAAELVPAAEMEEALEPEPSLDDEPQEYKQIGPLRVGIALFNIYLNEADELSRRLGTELAEWSHELDRPVGETAVALAHSLAGSSATVGFTALSELARTLEHAMARNCAMSAGTPHEAELFIDVSNEIRSLLHQFAAGFLKSPPDELLERLREHELTSVQRLESAVALEDAAALQPTDSAPLEIDLPVSEPPAAASLAEAREDVAVVDALQPELFAVFEEEAEELFGRLSQYLLGWSRSPDDLDQPAGAMRELHTLKGAARLAGAMRLGEQVHALESRIDELMTASTDAGTTDIEPLLVACDRLRQLFDEMCLEMAAVRSADSVMRAAETASAPIEVPEAAALDEVPLAAVAEPAPLAPQIDWSRFGSAQQSEQSPALAPAAASIPAVRVRAPLLDRLVNQAGEVSITRSRIAADVGQMKDALVDLSDNLDRLRAQLHDVEMQAETQISSRMEAARSVMGEFDPLEFDRYTRLQELTRMLAESINDVATVQRTLQRSVQSTEDELAAQGRLTRELQDDLLRTRMVEFEGLSERLQRVVRQAAKETGKQARLTIEGGSIEIDRGVLDRMTGAFEHLLRNSVVHGIELPSLRIADGKDATGSVVVAVSQSGNAVSVEVSDDGCGLDLPRILEKARASGLIDTAHAPAEDVLAQLIFRPGFTTVDRVTELAGRGIGMDVVRCEVDAIGGRIETSTTPGQGTSFKLVLPLTTAITQVVMVRCDALSLGVPSTLVDSLRRLPDEEVDEASRSGSICVDGEVLPFYWLGALLQTSASSTAAPSAARHVLIVRSASQRIAVQVDDVLGNQEVVVKNLGPQLSRMPGLAGMTLLASGEPALIYNPVALATLYGAAAREATKAAARRASAAEGVPVIDKPLAPLVMVVDDSLTVRRVTERMLLREGYRVVLAKDGIDALERLALEKPAIVLSDIEMPRMDGFDLLRRLRADDALRGLPVVMITSRIAQKHRDHALQLGADDYLGKPYSEEQLLGLIAGYTGGPAAPQRAALTTA